MYCQTSGICLHFTNSIIIFLYGHFLNIKCPIFSKLKSNFQFQKLPLVFDKSPRKTRTRSSANIHWHTNMEVNRANQFMPAEDLVLVLPPKKITQSQKVIVSFQVQKCFVWVCKQLFLLISIGPCQC